MLKLILSLTTVAVAVLLGVASSGRAQQPEENPILQIDAGMHIAPVVRIGVDAACRILLTGSKDKTARLWSLPTGEAGEAELLRTLRVPIGAGDQGKIFAVALSPDGRLAAAGGWDVYPAQKGPHAVYVFETATGRLIRRLGDLGSVVRHLVFSPDSRFLVATISDRGGMRVWNTISWTLAAEDRNYEDDSYGANFDKSGKLYTVSFDRNLRRYGTNFNLEAKEPVASDRPFTVAVHPDGTLLAVGYDRSTTVEIYATSDLKLLNMANTVGVNNGDFNSVAWSSDGALLYAGGKYSVRDERVVRIWDRTGREARDTAVASDTIHELLPCGRNVAVAAADPAFGLIDASGEKVLWQSSVTMDAREKVGTNFTLSSDAMRVRFGLGMGGQRPVLFDLKTGRLTDSGANPAGLAGPDTTSLKVINWKDSRSPRVDGKDLPLQGGEHSRSLAIAPGADHFVIGAEWHLRAYAANGEPLWPPVPSPAGVMWGVNISRENRIIVSALGDGTLRWNRLDDGRELLALFVNAADRRWVAWTPKGYYAASPGGESLIGWHVNRGLEQTPDFFHVERFRERFYRPDIVAGVLASRDEDIVIEDADRRADTAAEERDVRKLLPPVLEIVSHKDGDPFAQSKVIIEYTARPPTGEAITEIEVYLNGKKLQPRELRPAPNRNNDAGSLDVMLPKHDVKLTLIARAGNRSSEARWVHLRWTGSQAEVRRKPRLLALLIGVNNYRNPVSPLKYAVRDAEVLGSALKAQEGKAFTKVMTKLLTNPNLRQIKEGIQWLEDTTQEDDLTIILLSGHGATQRETFYFLPSDADPAKLRPTALVGEELVNAVRGMKGGKILLIDACRAGSAFTQSGMLNVPVDINKLANDMTQPVGAIYFGSSEPNQLSWEDDELKGGVFTTAFIEGLAGAADSGTGDGTIETDEMLVWLRRRVPELTRDKQTQVPIRHQSAPVEYTISEY